MKNLRKVLAMVLVVVMAFSLVTVASAATAPKVQDYKDASSIKQIEAVDLLTAAGVLNGSDGSFNPTADVTREQAAKIICYMLIGGKAADGLKTSTSSFSDVAATRWSAGAIQYCVVKGIINGMGDGTFAPEGNVTASQFAKMLLTALGYGKNGEYTGSNWEINVISDAQNLNILSLSVDLTAPATREQVAQYAFNAYTKVALVNYSKDISNYVERTYSVTSGGTTTVYPYTIAYQQGYTKSAVNDMGMYSWRKDGVALSTNKYSDSDYTVLGTNTLGTAIASLSNPNSSSYLAQADSGVKYFINGTYTNPSTTAVYTVTDVGTQLTAYGIGTVTKLIDTDDNGKYNQVQVTTRKACVVTAPSTVSAAGMVTIPGVSISTASGVHAITGVEQSKVKGVTTFDKNDVAIVSYDEGTQTFTVEKATKVQGQMTSGNTIMITFAGKTYFGAGAGTSVSAAKSLATFASDMANNLNVAATAYVDSYGYVVSIAPDDTTATKTYGLVYAYQHNGALSNSASLRILKQDGTIAVYSQAPDSTGAVKDLTQTANGDIDAKISANNYALVSYTFATDGKIKVTVESPDQSTVAGYTAKATSITTGAGTYYISATTKVFYFTGSYSSTNKGSVTTGYANTVTLPTGSYAVQYIKNSTATTVVDAIVIGYAATGVSSGVNYAYTIYGGGATTRTGADGNLYNDYNVYVNGEMKTLTAPIDVAAFAAGGGLYSYTLDANGYITSTTLANTTGTDKAFVPTDAYVPVAYVTSPVATDYAKADVTYIDASGNYFVFNNVVSGAAFTTKAVLTDSNTKYYLVNNSFDKFPFGEFTANATLSTSSVDAGTLMGTHYKVLNWAENTNGVATAVYFSYVTD